MCIRDSHCTGALGPNDRQRYGGSSLPAPGLQDFLHRSQNKGPRRTALAHRPRLQLAVDPVGNVDSRPHEAIVPYLWRTMAARGIAVPPGQIWLGLVDA